MLRASYDKDSEHLGHIRFSVTWNNSLMSPERTSNVMDVLHCGHEKDTFLTKSANICVLGSFLMYLATAIACTQIIKDKCNCCNKNHRIWKWGRRYVRERKKDTENFWGTYT